MIFFQLPIILGLYLKQALVAQLVERLSFGSEDTGSNPVWSHQFVREWSHGAQGGFGSILALIDSFLLERRPSSAPRAAREGDWLQASIRVRHSGSSPPHPRRCTWHVRMAAQYGDLKTIPLNGGPGACTRGRLSGPIKRRASFFTFYFKS